ncbi:MAG: hypothetical protein ABI856_18100 [Nitrospira sp.]
MNLRLVFALLPLLFLGAPLYAQIPCSDCVNQAEGEVKICLDSATGPSERNDCLDNRQARMTACSQNECKVERDEIRPTETQPTPSRPGLGTYSPTEGEWLALVMRATLRREATPDNPYSLDVVLAGADTLHILVRYRPPMTKDSLNKTVEAAREAIRNQARAYGWDKWVKIRETVELEPGKK